MPQRDSDSSLATSRHGPAFPCSGPVPLLAVLCPWKRPVRPGQERRARRLLRARVPAGKSLPWRRCGGIRPAQELGPRHRDRFSGRTVTLINALRLQGIDEVPRLPMGAPRRPGPPINVDGGKGTILAARGGVGRQGRGRGLGWSTEFDPYPAS